MFRIQSDYSQYLHTYEAFRLSVDSIPETASHANLVKNGTDSTELILTEESKEQMIQDRLNYSEQLKFEMDAYLAEQNAEIEKKQNEDKIKAMTVFRELSAGKTVPSYDENKLMQYDSKMYNLAKSAQMLAQLEQDRKQNKTEKSLWDEEDREQNTDYPTADELASEDMRNWNEFMQAQANSVVEISSDGIDASSITGFASMGGGFYQATFNTTI